MLTCCYSERPQETNYFLESRNIVPLRSEFKPPPILLSRKGPSNKTPNPLADGLNGLSLQGESSSDDEDAKQQPTLAERQAQAVKDREEKQRKYEERRQELFGSAATTSNNKSCSGKSSPGNVTPPTSRSATPNRGRGNGRGRGRGGNNQHGQPRPQSQSGQFEPSYAPKPDSTYLQRHENCASKPEDTTIRPQRAPKGPDGTGRGGFGFAARGGGTNPATPTAAATIETT